MVFPMAEPLKKIRVMVVEYSAYMRYVISEILNSDPEIEVVEKARDGVDALERLKKDVPDVITLDIQMPRMDGLTFLAELRKNYRIPTIMISSLTREGAEDTFKALDLGAVDFVPKPSGMLSLTLEDIQEQLIEKVKAASVIKPMVTFGTGLGTRVKERAEHSEHVAERQPNSRRETVIEPLRVKRTPLPQKVPVLHRIVAIGSSTGGPRALTEIIPLLPGDLSACVVVVQHMPPRFTTALAERLNSISEVDVIEASNGDRLKPGVVYIAPGDFHIHVGKGDTIYLTQEAPVNGVRPSIDILMKSVAATYRRKSIGVILTGMGSDGKEGVKMISGEGGTVFAEHETTCVVYGMPRVAVETGCVDRVLILPRIADELIQLIEN